MGRWMGGGWGFGGVGGGPAAVSGSAPRAVTSTRATSVVKAGTSASRFHWKLAEQSKPPPAETLVAMLARPPSTPRRGAPEGG